MVGILRELQRRNVPRAAILYATSVWALAQGIASLGPVVNAPEWTARWFLVAAIIGFPFWIAFAWFYEFTPDGIKRESEVVQSESLTRATGRKLDFWIIGALSIAVVLLLTDILVQPRGASDETGPVIAEKSVAVLPLVNESGDPNALYFSDGLSEAFIDALSQFPGLKVIARASSFHFRGSKDPVSVIGEKLGVAHLLEGSVQRAGDAVRISAELINVKDGTDLWSQHYDRPYTDLFKLQDDITNAVAAALKTRLMGGGNAPPPQSDRPPSGNLAAYNAFLEGKFYSRRPTAKDQQKAIAAFKTAVTLDPGYAAAWADLGIVELNVGLSAGTAVALAQALPLAKNDAEKALALAPDLGHGHNTLGAVYQYESNWSGAEAEYRRALQLKSSSAGAKNNLANVLALLGQPQRALALEQQALKLDPLQPSNYASLALDLMPLGRLGEAEAAMRKAIALAPDGFGYHFTLAQIAILRDDAKEALDEAQQEPAGLYQDLAIAQALQIGADRAAADAALKNLIAKYSRDAPYQIAQAYGIRKDEDAMFTWLEKARAANDNGLQQLLTDPFILPYRHDPRFAKLCKELKLPVPVN